MADNEAREFKEEVQRRFKAEAESSKFYKIIIWLIVSNLIAWLLFAGSNAWWVYRESQMEEICIEQENEGGYNSFIGNDGDINYGEAEN